MGTGEWGFSALVETVDGPILFDTGAKPTTVRDNAAALGLDLGTVATVVLSHHHDDHVGGLLTLRRSVAESSPDALTTVHGARGLLESRRFRERRHEVNDLRSDGAALREAGIRFVIHDGPTEIAPGVWLTGPVPRVHPEKNYSGLRWLPDRATTETPRVPDPLPESQALVVRTPQGLVVLAGCGHAGIVNIVSHAKAQIEDAPIAAAVGGFHLFRATAEHLDWTAQALGERGVQRFFGAHCTGEAAVARMATVPGVQRSETLAVGDRVCIGPCEPDR